MDDDMLFNNENVVIANVTKLDPNATLPSYAYDTDACFDLYPLEAGEVMPWRCKLIKTGLAIELPKGWELQVRSRSGNALKKNVFILNGVGTIDFGYTGDVGIILANFSDNIFEYDTEKALAQATPKPIYHAIFNVKAEVSETERNSGGFGSTDKN